ncbi:hypothetical protein MVEN_00597800 [Mycena venus]|uniref:DUF5648 domain-containing protein n=1 Tax=Mycena venus TaxID=2733690 RepID=A0A8H7D8B7_9AGAR|nr:hypothetical protein MVEN_00597800 [Mycena venus]
MSPKAKQGVFASIVTALLMAGQVYAAVILNSDQVVMQVRKSVQCPTAHASKLYRLVNPDTERSRYTLQLSPKSFTLASENGFEFDGVVARVFGGEAALDCPLRERDVALEKEDAYVDMGVAAYVFPRRVCGGQPFFRLFKDGNHFYTADWDEKDELLLNDGYTDPVIVGYVALKSRDGKTVMGRVPQRFPHLKFPSVQHPRLLETVPPPSESSVIPAFTGMLNRTLVIKGLAEENPSRLLLKIHEGPLEFARVDPEEPSLARLSAAHTISDTHLSEPARLYEFTRSPNPTWEWLPPAPLPRPVADAIKERSARRAISIVSFKSADRLKQDVLQFGATEFVWKFGPGQHLVHFYAIADAIRAHTELRNDPRVHISFFPDWCEMDEKGRDELIRDVVGRRSQQRLPFDVRTTDSCPRAKTSSNAVTPTTATPVSSSSTKYVAKQDRSPSATSPNAATPVTPTPQEEFSVWYLGLVMSSLTGAHIDVMNRDFKKRDQARAVRGEPPVTSLLHMNASFMDGHAARVKAVLVGARFPDTTKAAVKTRAGKDTPTSKVSTNSEIHPSTVTLANNDRPTIKRNSKSDVSKTAGKKRQEDPSASDNVLAKAPTTAKDEDPSGSPPKGRYTKAIAGWRQIAQIPLVPPNLAKEEEPAVTRRVDTIVGVQTLQSPSSLLNESEISVEEMQASGLLSVVVPARDDAKSS